MKKIYLNRKLFAIHSWVGLLLGVLFLLISIGGASIVFYSELTQLLYGNKIKVAHETNPRLSYDQLYEIACKEYSNYSYVGITHEFEYPDNAISIGGLDNPPTGLFENYNFRTIYVNPYNGRIIFRMDDTVSGNIVAWLDSLHASLRLGLGGATLVGVMSIAVLISLITGLIFYRKFILKALTFRVPIKFKNWRTINSDLHRVVGTWSLIVNILIFSSGFYMYYELFTPGWWKENWPPREELVSTQKIDVSLDTLAARAKVLVPEMKIGTIGILRDSAVSIFISGRCNDKLYMDVNRYASITFNRDGSLRENSNKHWQDMTGKEKFDNVNFYFLHTGWAMGLVGKVLWTIFGFTPAILSISGFVLWWRRKKFFQENGKTGKRVYSSALKSKPNSQVRLGNQTIEK